MERKSIGGKDMSRAELERAGIYYFKLNHDVDFPEPPNTKIPCHYIGMSDERRGVYKHLKQHINEKKYPIDEQLAKYPPTEYETALRGTVCHRWQRRRRQTTAVTRRRRRPFVVIRLPSDATAYLFATGPAHDVRALNITTPKL